MEMHYPKLIDRIKAVFLDFAVLMVLMIIVTQVFDSNIFTSETARMVVFILIFGLYEPLFVSLIGGTPGHYMLGLRVKRSDERRKNLPIYLAIIRFLMKSFLGWISLLTVPSNKERKALHDMAIGSVVIYKGTVEE